MEIAENHTLRIACRNTTVERSIMIEQALPIYPVSYTPIEDANVSFYGKGKTQFEFQPGDLLTHLAETDSGDGI